MDEQRCCHCDQLCKPVVQCSECSMTHAVVDAAGKQLAREAEQVLKFRASASFTTRRG